MSDITKCKGKGCPHKKLCVRYLAKPDLWQSYFSESPNSNGTKECEYFWSNDIQPVSKSEMKRINLTKCGISENVDALFLKNLKKQIKRGKK